jgi:phage antirepressor YoqD-like protein
MDKKINQADKLMRQNGAIQTSKTNSWTLRGIKYFFNKHGIFFLKNILAQ